MIFLSDSGRRLGKQGRPGLLVDAYVDIMFIGPCIIAIVDK